VSTRRALIDETGQGYGAWTVISKAGNRKHGTALWLCRCDCGKERAVGGSDLRSGKSAGCGCAGAATNLQVKALKFYGKDETGNVYSRWAVTGFDQASKGKAARWFCVCICGNTASVFGFSLRNGESQSCGCLHMENLKAVITRPRGAASLTSLIGMYRRGAKHRGHDFLLADDECHSIFTRNCFYCGAAPVQVHAKSKKLNGNFAHNGIDRADNLLGYTAENSVPCCSRCNIAKGAMSAAEFINLCNRVALLHCVPSPEPARPYDIRRGEGLVKRHRQLRQAT
jgi:hypothetical protein